MKRRRVYVTMNVQVSPDGIVRPRSMIWEDGEEYEVDRVKRVIPTDEGTRYTLMIAGKENTFVDSGSRGWCTEVPMAANY